MDSKKRSFTKAITWKLLGFLVLPIIAILTIKQAQVETYDIGTKSLLLLSVVYHATMFVLFFVHERMWNKVKWGK